MSTLNLLMLQHLVAQGSREAQLALLFLKGYSHIYNCKKTYDVYIYLGYFSKSQNNT